MDCGTSSIIIKKTGEKGYYLKQSYSKEKILNQFIVEMI